MNLEAWNVIVTKDISHLDLGAGEIEEEEIVGNTELELSPSQAKELGHALIHAAEEVEKHQ